MEKFILFAQPWWVNLLIFVPLVAYLIFRENRLAITRVQLLTVALFGIVFGLVEGSVVVYLRAALGFLTNPVYQQSEMLAHLPKTLLTIEFFREAATLIMLLSVALVAVKLKRERWAMFLWAFAFWDIFYYVWLWVMVRWPSSLTTPDVLFLIPVPWFSQVWFPLLVSGFSIAVVWKMRKQND